MTLDEDTRLRLLTKSTSRQIENPRLNDRSSEAQQVWYDHVMMKRNVTLNKDSLYAAPEDVTTHQIPGAVNFHRNSRSVNKLCAIPFMSKATHEFHFETGISVEEQIAQLTRNPRHVSCDLCLLDTKKQGRNDCLRTEEGLSVPDKKKAPVYIAFDNSSAKINVEEIMKAPNTIVVDGLEYNKTMVLIREEPIGGGLAHITSLVKTKEHRGKWLR